MAVTSTETAEHFADFVEPMMAEVDTLRRENLVFRRTRDLLLPKLISGELDVSELDIAVPEDAA